VEGLINSAPKKIYLNFGEQTLPFSKRTIFPGNLHELEGSIHIGEASTPYTNAAYVISLGSEKIYLCDCSIQKLPVRGLYIFQGNGPRMIPIPIKFSPISRFL
jgi:hypothetical protein